MSRRTRLILIAGIASLPALLLPAGREACAQQVGLLTNTRGLDFGRFVAVSGGTVVMSPEGVRTGSGVVLLSSPGAGAATFAVSVSRNGTGGSGPTTVSFSLPANGEVRLTSGGNSMALGAFSSSPAAGGTYPIGTTSTLSVGATLMVAPNQPPGNYSGSFTVIANFQ